MMRHKEEEKHIDSFLKEICQATEFGCSIEWR
jgi:hypothetical protein